MKTLTQNGNKMILVYAMLGLCMWVAFFWWLL